MNLIGEFHWLAHRVLGKGAMDRGLVRCHAEKGAKPAIMNAKSKRKPKNEAEVTTESSRRLWTVVLLAVVILFFSAVRFRLLKMALERDEGEYAYAGQLILQGIAPYKLAYNMKLPGTYVAYALIMAVFGQSPAGIHLGMILVNAASMMLIYLLARRLFDGATGLVAACSYGLLATSECVLGFAGHANHFVVLAALGGTLLLLKALDLRRYSLFFYSGVLMGLAFVMKQSGIVFIAFGAWYLLFTMRREWKNWRTFSQAAAYGAGAVVPFALTCLIMLFAGQLGHMWFWTFSYARQYAAVTARWDAWDNLFVIGSHVIQSYFLVWILAALGLAALAWDSHLRKNAAFVLGFLFFSWCGVCLGFYFRPHYFILVLPAISLLAGITISSGTREMAKLSSNAMARAIPAIVFVIVAVASVVLQGSSLFYMDPIALSRDEYGLSPFPEAEVVANHLKDLASPDARVAVLGSEPEVYFYSRRHSATGYIYVYPLFEKQAFALQMQHEMAKEIEQNRPDYIVLVRMVSSWQVLPGAERWILGWFKDYLHNHYEIVGVADEIEPQTRYVWGDAAKTYNEEADASVELYKRSDVVPPKPN